MGLVASALGGKKLELAPIGLTRYKCADSAFLERYDLFLAASSYDILCQVRAPPRKIYHSWK
jgi:hypothetical protein